MKSETTDETIEIKYDDLKHFDLAYCITCHCAQGSSFDFEYSIYEWQFFDKIMLYVSPEPDKEVLLISVIWIVHYKKV